MLYTMKEFIDLYMREDAEFEFGKDPYISEKKEEFLFYGMVSVLGKENWFHSMGYTTKDDKYWFFISYTNYENTIELKNMDQIISDIMKEEKYARYNWNVDYFDKTLKNWDKNELTHFELNVLSANSIERHKYNKTVLYNVTNEVKYHEKGVPHKEKPYKIYLGASDDFSLTKVHSYEELDDVKDFMDDLKYRDLVYNDIKDFVFTN